MNETAKAHLIRVMGYAPMGRELNNALKAFMDSPCQTTASKVFTYHRQSNNGSLDAVIGSLLSPYGFGRIGYHPEQD